MGREKGAELSLEGEWISRLGEHRAEGMAIPNFGAGDAICGAPRSAPARLCVGETISTRAPTVLPCEGLLEAFCSPLEGSVAEASSGINGSGSRRGPTLSETQSETNTPRISKILAALKLVMAASLAIS